MQYCQNFQVSLEEKYPPPRSVELLVLFSSYLREKTPSVLSLSKNETRKQNNCQCTASIFRKNALTTVIKYSCKKATAAFALILFQLNIL